ncbi:MAG: glycoside hydrolase [Gemmatimonadota bacterium]
MLSRAVRTPMLLLVLLAIGAGQAVAQATDSGLFQELRWRMIGPFRGGRTKSAVGIPSQPNVFYIGATNGGVWKSSDYGITWKPIFDDQPTGSIGAIAIAPSNPDVIYVGSGEGLQRPDLSTGDGIYKSTDGGVSWTHLGLRDGQQIAQIIIDPRNPDRLFVAVLGHPYGPNAERGIYRSLDGGKSFAKVLGKDENTGGVDLAFAPDDPNTVYAVLWEARQGPWENAAWNGPGSGLFKSTDGGEHWRPLTKGLPTFAADGLGRIGIAIAPSDARRMYASVDATTKAGLYRSDDAGENWARVTDDQRVVSRGSDMAEIKVHPTNPDVIFTASIVAWKSVDGGKSFAAFRGAPGGDDYQRIWINPLHPEIIIIASDQGAVVTPNGGESWSSWYNQPTAQFYHVSTDNAFPYRVCGGQQESGSACVASRGNDGRITFREWHPVGVEEYGYVAPDPLAPDVVFGGKVSRFDRRTGQTQQVGPTAGRGGPYRAVRTAPLLFSPVEPHTLFFGQNVVWKSTSGGSSWTRISPDLTRPSWDVPASVGAYRDTPTAQPTQRGVVYTLAPSYMALATLWAGTDDGLIHVTRDGGVTWKDVTPTGLTPWAKVSVIDAGRFDAATAYVAVNTIRLDDLRPHLYRTHDGGTSWTQITNGIPDGETVNAVREDPVRKGLLYAATERTVYGSLDDGDHWFSLRNNLPITSIRDIVVKDNDLVIGTHGRGFWILDDVTPLRQATPAVGAKAMYLFAPASAWRVRWNMNTDTPLPPDEPAGENPPDGAIVDYWLNSAAAAPVTLEILDGRGRVVRRYASSDTALTMGDQGNTPGYWIRPTAILSAAPGLHRFVWDEHYAPAAGTASFSYPIAATPHNTAPQPTGPWAAPGRYTVRLTVAGASMSQPLTIKLDPRVRTSPLALRQQTELSLQMYDGIAAAQGALQEIARVRVTLARQKGGAAADSLDRKLAALAGAAGGRGAGGARAGTDGGMTLTRVSGELNGVMVLLQESDAAPTLTARRAAAAATVALQALLTRWHAFDRRVVALAGEG